MGPQITRQARPAEVAALWPATKAARVFDSLSALATFAAANPWAVRVTDKGEALVVERWREHLDLLAIKGLWAAPHRIPALVDEAAAVAAAHGLSEVLSPLLSESAFEPFERAGMRASEHLVALQALAGEVERVAAPEGIALEPAQPGDCDRLVTLDAACFPDFWRYGDAEMARVLNEERVVRAVDQASGEIVGYSTLAVHAASATLGRLAVDPAHRRRRVARALLSDAAQAAQQAQAHALALCTQRRNDASRSLYREAGFTELTEPYLLAVIEARG